MAESGSEMQKLRKGHQSLKSEIGENLKEVKRFNYLKSTVSASAKMEMEVNQ